MKTLHIAVIMTLGLSTLFLIVSQYAYADSCSTRLTSYNAPQFYLLADGVFSGTVQHIDNTTDHQWKVYFTVDKLWKGSPSVKPLMIMTTTLQGCGYSIVQGEKYLVYTNGYPPFFNIVWSKPYADAQSDIAIIDDPKFQSDEKAQMELNKKLKIAKDAISNLMGSKMGNIPFNLVGVDEINSTLDVGIDSTKATLSEEQYLEKIKEIVGDIPIKITFGQNVAGVGDDTVQKILSPLRQFKSGISTMDINCSVSYVLTIKSEDGSPACVRPLTVKILSEAGWSKFESTQSNHSDNSKTNLFGIVGLMYYHGSGPCGVGACPLNTFNLKMNSNYTAYLLGYNICDGDSCIVRNDLVTLLPLNVIGIPNYKFIALPENQQWKYGDVFHIQVEVSSIPDNKTAIWTDLGNSRIVP